MKTVIRTLSILGATLAVLFVVLMLGIKYDRSSPFLAWAASYVPSVLMVEGGVNVCTESGSSNTFTLTCGTAPKSILAYATGVTYCFDATHANSGAATGNINTIGSKAITKLNGNNTALASGDIANGGAVCLMYDGTNLEMISQTGNAGSGSVGTSGSPSSGQMTAFSGAATITSATANNIESTLSATSTGSANAYILGLSPAATGLTGLCAGFISNFANTGATTININSLGVKNITKNGATATALAANDIKNVQYVRICYDGTQFEMMSPLGNSAAGTVQNVTATAPLNVANGTSTPALTYTGLNNTGDVWWFGWGPHAPVGGNNGAMLVAVGPTGGNNGTNIVEYRQVYFPGGVVNKLIYEVTTLNTTGTAHFSWGLYNTSGALVLFTGQLGISSGSTCSGTESFVTTGVKIVTSSSTNCGTASIGLGTNIAAGYYFEAVTADSVTAQFRSLAVPVNLLAAAGMANAAQIAWGKLTTGALNGVLTASGVTIPPTTADIQGMPQFIAAN